MITKSLITSALITMFCMNFTTAFAYYSKGGGGGDASEERVSEIRADLLNWINRGGSKSLRLPYGISQSEYDEKMRNILRPKAVLVTFVENDDSKRAELSVMVEGKPKTCRSFFSRRGNRPNIICHIARFREISPEAQYKLIHHEYAGLVYLEQNDGAISDYSISNQLTGFLENTTVLRLAIKNIDDQMQDLLIAKAVVNSLILNPLNCVSGTGMEIPSSSRGIYTLSKDNVKITIHDGEQPVITLSVRTELNELWEAQVTTDAELKVVKDLELKIFKLSITQINQGTVINPIFVTGESKTLSEEFSCH